MFKRNERVQNKLNCILVEENRSDYDGMTNYLRKFIVADDATYDAAYIMMFQMGKGISEKMYYNLSDIDTLHLDQSWWDSVLIDATRIGDKIYFASSSAHLMLWELLWCLYFNEQMMTDNGLEFPYQLVRDGKWTFDEFLKYCGAASNLNGDDKFSIKEDGKSVSGCSAFDNAVPKFLFGFDAHYVIKDESGTPVIDCGQRFVDASQRLAKFLGDKSLFLNMGGESDNLRIFKQNRSLFLCAEIKSSLNMRDLEQTFGILPLPKYDENQADYHSTSAHQSAVFTIPVSNKNPEEIGLIFDALSYESDKSVLPKYFKYRVEQKGMRNDESIEMLQIIKKTRSYDIGVAYQWVNSLVDRINTKLLDGNSDVLSTIDAAKKTVNNNIQATLDAME